MNASTPTLRVVAPGRVNLIGDHTDYMGGLAMPMTVPMATVIEARRVHGQISLESDQEPEALRLQLPVADPAHVVPLWGRYVAGIAHLLGSSLGFDGIVRSDLPVGAGLSSSAALEVATALMLGATGTTVELAALCQRGEHIATGVPSGMMDQMAILGAEAGKATLIDFDTLSIEPVPIPSTAQFWVIDSHQRRTLDGSEYGTRRAQCEQAETLIGPLRRADDSAIASIEDPIIRARARHVASECARVRDFADALQVGDIGEAGNLMTLSHGSLRDDFQVSTKILDRCVLDMLDIKGVHGARLTGAGFGGCLVVLADPGVDLDGWRVSPSGPARLEIL